MNIIASKPPMVAQAGSVSLEPALSLIEVSKAYGEAYALKHATLDFFPGEIHAIIGENGAGKSTLISAVAGVVPRSAGEIRLNGNPIDKDASIDGIRKAGVAVVFQHPALLPDLTVLENLQLVSDEFSGTAGRGKAEKLLAMVATDHLRVELGQRVDTLTLARKHVVEIARALAGDPKVLFLDEPTEPFQAQDVEKLFSVLRQVRSRGVAIIYVSHRLHEMQQIADRISVIRDGEIVDSRPASAFTTKEIVTLIAGRPIDQVFPPKAEQAGATVLAVDNLSGDGFAGISLHVAAGEIVGLTGVEGQGQREFIRALAGLQSRGSGTITLNGAPYGTGVNAARAAGIAFVSDDRHAEGLFSELTIQANVGAGLMKTLARWGLVRGADERDSASAIISDMNVRAEGTQSPILSLSGGNQQKVLVGREIATRPKVLLADEPTKGVDIGARSEIYRKLRAISSDGVGVVVAASDGIELEGLCDRVLVFARGRVVRELAGDEVTDHLITGANLSATGLRETKTEPVEAPVKWSRLLGGDHFPIAVLALLTAAIIFATSRASEFFLTELSIQSMIIFMAILTIVCLAQLCVVITGGIDLSTGPLMGLVVVSASYLLPDSLEPAQLVLWTLLVLAGATLFGLLQGLLIVGLRLPAITATLGTFVGLQGMSLLLRPTPGGSIAMGLADGFSAMFLWVPLAAWLAIGLALLLELVLFRTDFGRRLRAVGSDPDQCQRIGVNAGRMSVISFTLSGFLSGLAGIILAGQVGMGTASAGVDYTLMSITAVVLGGAAVTGGRGSFLATMAGALLIQSTISASSFLQADTALQYCIVGVLTLLAAGSFSLVRHRKAG